LELVVDAEEDDLDFWELDERLRFSNFFFFGEAPLPGRKFFIPLEIPCKSQHPHPF